MKVSGSNNCAGAVVRTTIKAPCKGINTIKYIFKKDYFNKL